MFGYVQANTQDLTPEERERYRAVYCGLCHTLGERYGFSARLGLTYDLTFLAILLSSLYEPTEKSDESRCVVHPCKKHHYVMNRYVEYAADMTVALVYYKCLDDWNDEKRLSRKCYASMLSKAYKKVRAEWPEQCSIIETELGRLSEIEKRKDSSLDAAANSFGRLMAGIFVMEKDHWEPYLYKLGYGLGKYIYIADAAVDLKQDQKRGNYNPLASLNMTPEMLKSILKMMLGEVSQAFEGLPLLQDVNLLRNILYSGIWIKFNIGTQEERKTKENGK